MNKYIFEDANNGYYYSYTLFETEAEISNQWHLDNIIKVHNLTGPLNSLNGLPYGSAYARSGENFDSFKEDCEKSGVKIIKIGEVARQIPEEYKHLEVINGISGNY